MTIRSFKPLDLFFYPRNFFIDSLNIFIEYHCHMESGCIQLLFNNWGVFDLEAVRKSWGSSVVRYLEMFDSLLVLTNCSVFSNLLCSKNSFI